MKQANEQLHKPYKLDNKGLSLIELIITVAISSFVLISVFSFMLAGTRGYASASAETDLQSTRTTTMNFISDAIMSASQNASHIVLTPTIPGEGDPFTFSTVYEVVDDRTTGTVVKKGVTFYYDGESSLYVYEADATSAEITSKDERHLVSKYVKDFDVELVTDPSDATKVTSVKVKADFEVQGRTSTAENEYRVRNK